MLAKQDATATRMGKCYIVLFGWMHVNGPTIDIVTVQTTYKERLLLVIKHGKWQEASR
jgi:hypothetical protein